MLRDRLNMEVFAKKVSLLCMVNLQRSVSTAASGKQ